MATDTDKRAIPLMCEECGRRMIYHAATANIDAY